MTNIREEIDIMRSKIDIQIRDPYVLPLERNGEQLFYLSGSTDANIGAKEPASMRM
ncbi:hypothetical protein EV294_101890 [Paenibacillus sp. BK033]|nr:hypothetical protein EV294_101890 [Paenibacillus sp. BK033]